jgi:hypothetical protein
VLAGIGTSLGLKIGKRLYKLWRDRIEPALGAKYLAEQAG